MKKDDDILGPLARSAVPDLDPVSRNRIESGLRVQHAAKPDLHHAPIRRRLVIVPVLALVLLIATVAFVVRDEAVVAALEVRNAEDVTVTLPTGEVIENPADGFALVDGAVVVVGDSGTITIDDITLDAGVIVTVRDRQLVTDVVATTTAPSRPTPTDSVDVTPDDAPPATRAPEPSPTTALPSEPLPPDSRPGDSRPPDPARPTPSDAPIDIAPPPPVSPRDEPAPEPDTGGVEVAIALHVSAADGAVRLRWNTEGTENTSWSVLVLRTVDGSAPLGPDHGVTVAEGPRGEYSDPRAGLPDGARALRYRVVIVDAGGGIVARGAIQTIDSAGS